MLAHPRSPLLPLLAGALLAACFQPTSETRVAQSLVGAAGGTLATQDGALRVVVPAGALESDTVLTATPAETKATNQGESTGQAFLLGPEGTRFSKPVTVTLAVSNVTASARVVIATAPKGSDAFESLGGVREGDTVRAETTHFSVFVPVVQPDADAGTDAGATEALDAGPAASPDAGSETADASVCGSESVVCSQGSASLPGTLCKMAGDCPTYMNLDCTSSSCVCSIEDAMGNRQVTKTFGKPAEVCVDAAHMRAAWNCDCGFAGGDFIK